MPGSGTLLSKVPRTVSIVSIFTSLLHLKYVEDHQYSGKIEGLDSLVGEFLLATITRIALC